MDATAYHNLTSYTRNAMTPHHLDWDHVPLLQKVYPQLRSVALKLPETLPGGSLQAALGGTAGKPRRGTLGFKDLSAILILANGITAKRRYGDQTQVFRSSPSAGALYPNEIYVAAGSVDGLSPGLYNYQVMDTSLVELRAGPCVQQVDSALRTDGRGLAAASLLITGIFFRSAWKYRARAYRYVLLDAGHLIENVALAAAVHGVAYSVHYDFNDKAMARIGGIDRKREACVAVVKLYTGQGESRRTPREAMPDTPALPEELMRASCTSMAEVHYPAIQQVSDAGSISPPVQAQHAHAFQVVGDTPQAWLRVRGTGAWAERQPAADSMFQRRSRRNFVPIPMPTSRAMQLMQSLCMNRGQAGDEGVVYGGCMTPGFAAVNIEAFDRGIYLLDTEEKAYGMVSDRSSGDGVARVCLDQAWLRNGSLHFLFMANLNLIDLNMGARGYRYAMLNAGRAGQRIYLAATALGLGACGIGAIYDAEARQMLALNDESALLYLVAVGVHKA